MTPVHSTPRLAPVLSPKSGAAPASPRVRFLRWVVWGSGSFLVVVLLLVLFRDPILKKALQANLRRETGLEAEIGELHLDLRSASLRIADLKLPNPPGFGTNNLLEVPEVYVQLRSSTNGAHVAFREIRFHLATLNVVRNPQKQFNVQALEQPIKRRRDRLRRKRKPDVFATIDRISVTLGDFNYTDLARPKRNQSIALEIQGATATDLQTEEELKTWAGSLLARIFMRQVFRDPPGLRELWAWVLEPAATHPRQRPEQDPEQTSEGDPAAP